MLPSPRLALVAALALNGCATLTGLIHVAGGHVSTSSWDSAVPLGRTEQRVRVEFASLVPPTVRCQVERRAARERLTHESWGIDGAGRLAYGFLAFSETALSGISIVASTQRDPPQWGFLVAGSLAAVDAIATWILTFALPNSHVVSVEEREGQWRTTQSCPAGLRLTIAGRELPVDARGALSPSDRAWAASQLVSVGASLRLSFGERVVDAAPSIADRCAAGMQLGIPLPNECQVAAPMPAMQAPMAPPATPTLEFSVTISPP